MSTLGERIREARIKKGLTQKQLAEMIGVKHMHCFDIFRQVSVLSDVDFRRNMAKKI